MEPRKYSTGTKGRIKMHSDKCKEFIHANSPDFSLAKEFIESIDPEFEERIWQRFQSPEDILPELQAWLSGGEVAPTAPSTLLPVLSRQLPIKPASHLAKKPDSHALAALEKIRAWISSDAGRLELGHLPPVEAAEIALRKYFQELTGTDPRNISG